MGNINDNDADASCANINSLEITDHAQQNNLLLFLATTKASLLG